MDTRWISPLGDEGIYKINTGKWRVFRPVIDEAKCIVCALCAFYCPVAAIRKKQPNDKHLFIDMEYCKGCGLCEAECPRKAITMVREEDV